MLRGVLLRWVGSVGTIPCVGLTWLLTGLHILGPHCILSQIDKIVQILRSGASGNQYIPGGPHPCQMFYEQSPLGKTKDDHGQLIELAQQALRHSHG